MKEACLAVAVLFSVATLSFSFQANAASSCVCKEKNYTKLKAYCGYCVPGANQKPVSYGSTQLFWFSRANGSCTITSWTDSCDKPPRSSCVPYAVKGTISLRATCTNKTAGYGMLPNTNYMKYQAWNNGCVWTCSR